MESISQNNLIQNKKMLLRASEVAEILNISSSLAYKLMLAGTIPTVRFGRSVRVRMNDLDEFVKKSWTGWKE